MANPDLILSQNDHETRAIVVVSVGDRPWLDAALSTIAPYAEACRAELLVHRALPSADLPVVCAMPDTPGRPRKAAYACKTYYAWKALVSGVDRVLVLDDTCCVTPGAPDIFAQTPREHLGYTGTSVDHARQSFDIIEWFIDAHHLAPVPFDAGLYMNSGVLLYDTCHTEALRPDLIERAGDLLYAWFPHQTLTYYLTRRGAFATHKLPKSFNRMPAVQLGKERRDLIDIVPHLSGDTWIYHFSGLYRHRARLIEQTAHHLMKTMRP